MNKDIFGIGHFVRYKSGINKNTYKVSQVSSDDWDCYIDNIETNIGHWEQRERLQRVTKEKNPEYFL